MTGSGTAGSGIAGSGAARSAAGQRAEIREHRGIRKIHVDGKPFLVLGIQFDFLNCTKVADFDMLFDHAARMGVNTVFFPVRWFVVEPEEGRFDWTVLDHCLASCRARGLRMAVLWFGTNQGGTPAPAPDWVKKDAERFRRMKDPEGLEVDGLCPACEETRRTEKRSFDALLGHLAAKDGKEGTVILLQIENEICVRMNHGTAGARQRPAFDPWQERCHCGPCDSAFAASGLTSWRFGIRSMTEQINGLLRGQKGIFPALTYVNFPINPLRGGEDVVGYLDGCPDLDIVGADYYGFSPGDLAFAMNHFSQGRNIPFIAEHSTESTGDADMNLYLAVCQHGVQCFSPWAIDHAFGWRAWRDRVEEKPFVSRDGTWSEAAVLYGAAQSALARIAPKVAQCAGTGEMMWYVSHRIPRNVEERRWGLRWRMTAGKNSQWICCRVGEAEFTVAGVGTVVTVGTADGRGKVEVEQGYWRYDLWTAEETLQTQGEGDSGGILRFELAGGKAFRIRTI